MPAPKITLFFDIVSPFAYEAFHILRHNAVFKDVELTFVPMFLGGLMKACGNSPPISIKNKDKWIMRERLRWARLFDVPMHDEVVSNFPPNTMHTMRALAVITDQQQLGHVVERLYDDFFVHHKAIETKDVFEPILRGVLGAEAADQVIGKAGSEGKAALKANTDKAYDAGAFGAPWFMCTRSDGQTDCFWGVDHMGQLSDFLGLEKPLASGGWKAVL